MLRVIFPCHPIQRSKVDDDFEVEYNAVKLLGGIIVLFDYDAFISSGILHITSNRISNETILSKEVFIYRGWMMTPDEYCKFEKSLLDISNIRLINTHEQYKTCHLFPLVYPYISDKTPTTFASWGSSVNHEKLEEIFTGRVIVKDWVKSAKGSRKESTFIRDITNRNEVQDVVTNLIEERGKLFINGIVYKKYVDIFKDELGYNIEFRAFYFNGKLVTYKINNGNPKANYDFKYKKPFWLDSVASRIPSNFFTIDIAYNEFQEPFIIEVGDGNVSGLASSELAISYYENILNIIKSNI